MVGRTGKLYVNTFNNSTILKYSLEYLLAEGMGLSHENILKTRPRMPWHVRPHKIGPKTKLGIQCKSFSF